MSLDNNLQQQFEGSRLEGIIRVSKVGGRGPERFNSPEDQKRDISAWAEAHGAQIVRWVEEIDQSASGRVPRPKFEAALRRAEDQQTDGLVVARIDRFTRNLLNGTAALDRLKKCRAIFWALDNPVDITTDSGEFTTGIMMLIAQWQHRRQREAFKRGCERAVEEKGIHLSPVPPFGYTRGEDRRLALHPINGPLMTEIYRRAATGESWSTLAAWLEAQGALTAYMNSAWSGRAVKALVRNEVYLGVAYKGTFRKTEAHPALTDLTTWQLAQRRKASTLSRSQQSPALGAGLIRCAGCRYGMKITVSKQRGRIYQCHCTHAGGRCGATAAVRASEIEPLIVETFFAKLGDLELRAEHSGCERQKAQQLVDQRRTLWQMWQQPEVQASMSHDEWVAGLQQRKKALDEALDALAALTDPELPQRASLRRLWPSLAVEEQRRLLSTVIDCVFVRKASRPGRHAEPASERALMVLRGHAPVDMPRRGRQRNNEIVPFEFDQPPVSAGAADSVGRHTTAPCSRASRT